MTGRESAKKNMYDVTMLYFYKSRAISIELEINAESKASAAKIAIDNFVEMPPPEGFRLSGTIVH